MLFFCSVRLSYVDKYICVENYPPDFDIITRFQNRLKWKTNLFYNILIFIAF